MYFELGDFYCFVQENLSFEILRRNVTVYFVRQANAINVVSHLNS